MFINNNSHVCQLIGPKKNFMALSFTIWADPNAIDER